jgi:hypothetical protein
MQRILTINVAMVISDEQPGQVSGETGRRGVKGHQQVGRMPEDVPGREWFLLKNIQPSDIKPPKTPRALVRR